VRKESSSNIVAATETPKSKKAPVAIDVMISNARPAKCGVV
jgi:hypothetical protein